MEFWLIMVVEDNDTARDGIVEALENLNYQVISANNGLQALEKLQYHEENIDLVVSDMVMPGMGGKELFEKLQRFYPNVSMIFITGYPIGTGTRELISSRSQAWVKKPFKLKDLVSKIQSMLQ